MFSKFITNYIEQGWWHSSLTLKCMHLLLKEVNKRGRHAYNLHGWTCLPSGYCNGNTLPHNWNFLGCCEAEAAILLFSVICSWFSKVLLFVFVTKINSQTFNATWLIYVPPKVKLIKIVWTAPLTTLLKIGDIRSILWDIALSIFNRGNLSLHTLSEMVSMWLSSFIRPCRTSITVSIQPWTSSSSRKLRRLQPGNLRLPLAQLHLGKSRDELKVYSGIMKYN